MDASAPAVPFPLARVLVLADWRTDPAWVIDACRRRARHGDVTFALVVPAWLHGLDWLGDPRSSRPCATRQLETLVALADTAGLRVEFADVGDPDPTSAVDDALQTLAATEILLCRTGRRGAGPFDLEHRLRRLSGLPVDVARLDVRSPVRERRRWRALMEGGHCIPDPIRAR
jgi:hypothetical protein